jgi:citronellyl-CoA synthetase
MINTIPDKIPEPILVNLQNKNYDKIILFTLAVFGHHKLRELVNDPNESLQNRMEKELFFQWKDKLIQNHLIEEYVLDDELNYRITSNGEEEFMKYLRESGTLELLETSFPFFFETVKDDVDLPSQSISGYTVTYKDFVFGVLSLIWRIDTFIITEEFEKIGPDKKVSLGKCLERNAVKFANNKALLYEDEVYTYKELNEWINRYANFFLSLGVQTEEVINVFMENRPHLMFIMAAMSKVGTIGSLINTKQRAATLRHSLTLNDVRFNVIGEELIDAFLEVKEDLDLKDDDKLFYLEDKGERDIPEGFVDLRELILTQDIINPPTTEDRLGRETYVFIFTSGTTGLPKAAHIRNVHTVGSMLGWGKMALNMQPDDIYYISLPIYHSNALHLGWASAIVNGSAVALARKFSVTNFWNDIRKYKATCFNYIGEICRYLVSDQKCGKSLRRDLVFEKLSSIME